MDTYNQALRQVAAARAVQCLPVHDTLASLLPAAPGPPPYRGRFGPMIRASLSHNLLRRSWDRISAANGLAVLTRPRPPERLRSHLRGHAGRRLHHAH